MENYLSNYDCNQLKTIGATEKTFNDIAKIIDNAENEEIIPMITAYISEFNIEKVGLEKVIADFQEMSKIPNWICDLLTSIGYDRF